MSLRARGERASGRTAVRLYTPRPHRGRGAGGEGITTPLAHSVGERLGVRASPAIGLQTAAHGLQTADAGLQTADADLQTAAHGLQTASRGLQTAAHGLQTADAGLQTAAHGLQTADDGKPS